MQAGNFRSRGRACLAMLAGLVSPLPAAAGGMIEAGLALPSPTLGRGIPYAIYVPQSATRVSTRVPVLYLLHGHGDDERAWVDKGEIVETLERNIASGALQPLAVVMPAAGNSWYVDDAVPNRYGTVARAFNEDLVDGIEGVYRVGGCRQARAVGGLSMGGYGAMLLALDRSSRFGAAISLSGSLFSELPNDMERRRATYEWLYQGVFGRPFDPNRFLEWNVFKRLDRFEPDALRPAVWLAAGERDFPSILAGTVRLHAELQRRKFTSHLSILNGEHTWDLWKAGIEPALLWLSGKLDGGCETASKR